MEDKKVIAVQNRDFGSIGYSIPDLNLHREFQPNEIKYITFDELFKLVQVPGGEYIINNYLIIHDQEAIEELIGAVEPEYFYTEDKVIELMKNGSIDEFEDCLNFAPEGVIELIKQYAVKLPLNDVAKRDLILKKTGFNVANAIDLTKDDQVVEVNKPTRKAEKPKTEDKPVRKVVKPTSAQ